MKRLDLSIGWGVLLIGLGIVFLLQSLGIFGGNWGWVISPIFFVGGLFFFYLYFANKEQWWAIIPGCALVGLAILIALGSLNSELAGRVGAFIFFGSISVAFWFIYLRNRASWWAIIPGGVLASLALLVLFADTLLGGEASVGIFFLGLGATFLLLYVLPKPTEVRMGIWPLIPGGILGAMGILFLLSSFDVWQWLWPIALIVFGVYLVLRFLARRNVA